MTVPPNPPFKNPFGRPWMTQSGGAAAATGGSIGMKGIIAGELLMFKFNML